jgi:SET domain-containing protein
MFEPLWGEEMTHRANHRRYRGHTAHYSLVNADSTQEEPTVLDAATVRCIAAMMNHSATPNVVAFLSVAPDTSTRVEFRTLQAIPAGQELCFDYNAGHSERGSTRYTFHENERSVITRASSPPASNPPSKRKAYKSTSSPRPTK